MPQVEAAQAASEIETLQEYLDTCEGVRRALGITGAAPQLHPLAQGECNVNYWFDAPERALAQLEARGGVRSDRLILRVNHVSQMHLSNQIAYEFGALDALEACGRTPRTLWCDASCRLVPWGVGVEEFLPGRPLAYEADLAQAARILADVHALDVPEAARATLVCPENPLLAIAQECREMFETYRAWARAEQHVLARVDAMMARAFALAEGEGEAAHTTGAARATGAAETSDAQAAGASGAAKTGVGAAGAAGEAACAGTAGGATRRRCIVNTELNSRNFLIGPTDETCYLVDWEKPLLSVPEQDLAHFLVPTTTNWKTDTVLTRAQRDSFLAAYERAVDGRFPTAGLRDRLDAFLTVTCLRGITWCAMACVGYTEGDAALRNADTFTKIQQFLSPAYLEMIWEEFYR